MKRVLSLSEIDALKEACKDNSERELIENLSSGTRLSHIAQDKGVNYHALFSKFKKIATRTGTPHIVPHDLRWKFLQYEFHIKGGYDFSALSGVMGVVK